MKLFSVRRTSRLENRYHVNMGRLLCVVVKIQKTFLGIPYKTLHKYRETYYGEIKSVEDCKKSKI